MNELHVVPRNDTVAHPASEDCICGPTPETVAQPDGSVSWLIVHHSLDGREGTECDCDFALCGHHSRQCAAGTPAEEPGEGR